MTAEHDPFVRYDAIHGMTDDELREEIDAGGPAPAIEAMEFELASRRPRTSVAAFADDVGQHHQARRARALGQNRWYVEVVGKRGWFRGIRESLIEATSTARHYARLLDAPHDLFVPDSATLKTRTNDSETLSQKEGF